MLKQSPRRTSGISPAATSIDAKMLLADESRAVIGPGKPIQPAIPFLLHGDQPCGGNYYADDVVRYWLHARS
jgi:hypothetical protein